jgi:predicted DNA-binding transcriptional regulator AlpA
MTDEPTRLRRMLRLAPARGIFGLSVSAFYDAIRRGVISRPVKMGEARSSTVAWFEDELVEDQQRMIAARGSRMACLPTAKISDAATGTVAADVAAATPSPGRLLTQRKAELHARDQEMVALLREGWTRFQLAKKYKVSVSRIGQILQGLGITARDKEPAEST